MQVVGERHVKAMGRVVPVIFIHWQGRAKITEQMRTAGRRVYVIESSRPSDFGPVPVVGVTTLHPSMWGDQFHRATAGQMGVSEAELHRAVQEFLGKGEREAA